MEKIQELYVRTSQREEMVDITLLVMQGINESGIKNGVCYLSVPHTTCGLTVNEHADSDVVVDILATLNELIPGNKDYRHREGNSPAHVKASLMGSTQVLLVADGKPRLGTWQGVFLCEYDGPRDRKIWLKVIQG